MDYKGLRDKHLNVFCEYDSKSWLENNITKAFINVIDSLETKDKRILFTKLFGINLDDEDYSFKYYLQRKPSVEEINRIPDENKIMFCFSPTGEHWGYDGQDIHDNGKVKEAIFKKIKCDYQNYDEKEIKELANSWFDEYLRSSQRNGSNPDAWILVYKDKTPQCVVIMENKLYNLDPNQINNHIEKSLMIKDSKKEPIYCKYDDINSILLNNVDYSYMTDQYLEYMTILGYKKIDDFIVACGADKEIREQLAFQLGDSIAQKLNYGNVDRRDSKTWRIKLSGKYKYIREINLQFWEDGIHISLCFGSTQNTGRWMLQSISKIDVDDSHLEKVGTNFHLLYQRGRNIGNSYPDYFYKKRDDYKTDSQAQINEFIEYWRNNLDLLRTCTPEEAITLYSKIYSDEMINENSYKRLERQMIGKKNKVLVVPEIEIKYLWRYEEVVSIGENEFVNQMKIAIDKAFNEMKIY